MRRAAEFYAGERLLFGTKHGKEEILAPLVSALGMHCEAVAIDTDQFGTFTGEVERQGSIRDTLRKKIGAAAALRPDGRLFLASEGSFGPDPFLGLLPVDLESLLLWDRQLNIEIYAEHLGRNPVIAEIKLLPGEEDLDDFLASIGFPEQGLIVRPESSFMPIFKGIHSHKELAQAIAACRAQGEAPSILISTDQRASHNPGRREAIAAAGRTLVEKLQSFCPGCGLPGFAISEAIPGLPCSACGTLSAAARAVKLSCVKCPYHEEKPRPDGKTSIPMEECEACNP